MMQKEIITLNRPNWLGSEVGLTLKSVTIPYDFATKVTENNRTIVKSGTYIATPHKGLLYGDIDITDRTAENGVIASVMIGGRYIDAKLPTSVASNATDLIAQGLFAIVEGAVIRPDFGGSGI